MSQTNFGKSNIELPRERETDKDHDEVVLKSLVSTFELDWEYLFNDDNIREPNDLNYWLSAIKVIDEQNFYKVCNKYPEETENLIVEAKLLTEGNFKEEENGEISRIKLVDLIKDIDPFLLVKEVQTGRSGIEIGKINKIVIFVVLPLIISSCTTSSVKKKEIELSTIVSDIPPTSVPSQENIPTVPTAIPFIDEQKATDEVSAIFLEEEELTTSQEREASVISQEEIEFLSNHEISYGDRERPVVMMTYDDGGRKEDIEYIMSVYESYDVRTTFFVTGEWVLNNKELVKDMIDKGFELGCHSWDHPVMTELSKEDARKQIEDFLDVVAEIDQNYKIKYIRFPFGARNKKLKEISAEYGLQSVMWSDESGGNTDKTLDYILDNLRWGSIVLSHSTRRYDISMVEKIIKSLQAQGYQIVTISEGIAEKDVYEE